jgi:predicted ABC-type transport system involved in lysophospholipase L1 biosynthesis ATPase subunit
MMAAALGLMKGLRGKLEAAEEQLDAPVELAEVHVAEAQIVEVIGVLGTQEEELLQVDAGLVELAGGEELMGGRGSWTLLKIRLFFLIL